MSEYIVAIQSLEGKYITRSVVADTYNFGTGYFRFLNEESNIVFIISEARVVFVEKLR